MLYAKTLEYRTSREQFVYIFSRLAQAYVWTKTKAFCQSCTLRFLVYPCVREEGKQDVKQERIQALRRHPVRAIPCRGLLVIEQSQSFKLELTTLNGIIEFQI